MGTVNGSFFGSANAILIILVLKVYSACTANQHVFTYGPNTSLYVTIEPALKQEL